MPKDAYPEYKNHEDLHTRVDSRRFLDRQRALKEAMHGTAINWNHAGEAVDRLSDGWKHGNISRQFEGMSPRSTGEDALTLYRKLNGEIWHDHQVAMIEENENLTRPYPEFNAVTVRDGKEIDRLQRIKDGSTTDRRLRRLPSKPDIERNRI